MEASEITHIYERQRRNLILISVLLFGIVFTGITITEINFVFVKLNNPDHIKFLIILWVIFCYFIIRYNQYLRTIGCGKMRENIKDFTNKEIAKRIFKKSKILRLEEFDFSNHSEKCDSFKRHYNIMTPQMINENTYDFSLTIAILGIRENSGTITIESQKVTKRIDYRKYKFARLIAWIKGGLLNHEYFEYYLPNLLALFVYIYALPSFLGLT